MSKSKSDFAGETGEWLDRLYNNGEADEDGIPFFDESEDPDFYDDP